MIIRHALRHHRVGSYHRVPADGDATDDDGSRHDACTVFDYRVFSSAVATQRDVMIYRDIAADSYTFADDNPNRVRNVQIGLDGELRRDVATVKAHKQIAPNVRCPAATAGRSYQCGTPQARGGDQLDQRERSHRYILRRSDMEVRRVQRVDVERFWVPRDAFTVGQGAVPGGHRAAPTRRSSPMSAGSQARRLTRSMPFVASGGIFSVGPAGGLVARPHCPVVLGLQPLLQLDLGAPAEQLPS